MKRILFLLIAMFFALSNLRAQQTPSDKKIMDSLLQNDEFLKMINNIGKASSFFRVNVVIGNKLYSDQNKFVQTLQSTNPFVITPSAEYNHKSGFGIAVAGFLFNENKATNFYQYTVSPSYSYIKGKTINFISAYTHYFEKKEYTSDASPVQDEFYASILFKKSWIRPGINSSYAWGTYHEVIKIDTTIQLLNRQIHINYTDTTTTMLRSFSFAATLERSFTFYNLFSIKDGIIFTPQVYLFSGVNSYDVSHTSTLANFNAYTKKKLKRIRHFQSQSQNNNQYELQSAGLDLDANYSIGKFYVEPDIYFDYYLPQTNDKRLTEIYSFNIGITF